MRKRILLLCHCPSDNTSALRDAALDGIGGLDLDDVHVVSRNPLDADADDVQVCDGIIIGTTENFGYMAGLTKDFFERIYYPCLERTQGLPVAIYIRAGEDGHGTKSAVEKITTGLRWKPIAETLILRGPFRREFGDQVKELSMTMAAGLEADVF